MALVLFVLSVLVLDTSTKHKKRQVCIHATVKVIRAWLFIMWSVLEVTQRVPHGSQILHVQRMNLPFWRFSPKPNGYRGGTGAKVLPPLLNSKGGTKRIETNTTTNNQPPTTNNQQQQPTNNNQPKTTNKQQQEEKRYHNDSISFDVPRGRGVVSKARTCSRPVTS